MCVLPVLIGSFTTRWLRSGLRSCPCRRKEACTFAAPSTRSRPASSSPACSAFVFPMPWLPSSTSSLPPGWGSSTSSFWAACLCWIADFVARLIGQGCQRGPGSARFSLARAILISIYGFINARLIRERRVTVTLPNLPESWKGRTALLVSDLHLGNINAAGFSRRIAAIARRLDPSIIFIAGDLYDGSKADPARIAAPLFDTPAEIRHVLLRRQPRGLRRRCRIFATPSRAEGFASCTMSGSTWMVCR